MKRNKKDILSTDKLKNIIDQCIELGTLNLYFTSGEAMLKKDFDEIYKYCRKKGLSIGILSNGISITDKKLNCLKSMNQL